MSRAAILPIICCHHTKMYIITLILDVASVLCIDAIDGRKKKKEKKKKEKKYIITLVTESLLNYTTLIE